MLDVQLFGMKAGWHHLMNVFFHIANALLLFLILQRMTKALWQSAFVAALFALHPLHVESVAWTAERKDVLSTLFWMLTLGAYTYYVERPGIGGISSCLDFSSLGLMSKPMVVTFPFVLLLLGLLAPGPVSAGEASRADPHNAVPPGENRQENNERRQTASAKNPAPVKERESSACNGRDPAAAPGKDASPDSFLSDTLDVITILNQQTGHGLPAGDSGGCPHCQCSCFVCKVHWKDDLAPGSRGPLSPDSALPFWQSWAAVLILSTATCSARRGNQNGVHTSASAGYGTSERSFR